MAPSREAGGSFILNNFITARFISLSLGGSAAHIQPARCTSIKLSNWVVCPAVKTSSPILLTFLIKTNVDLQVNEVELIQHVQASFHMDQEKHEQLLEIATMKVLTKIKTCSKSNVSSSGGAVPEDQPGGARRQELAGEGHDRAERPLLHLLPHHQPSRQVAFCSYSIFQLLFMFSCCRCYC